MIHKKQALAILACGLFLMSTTSGNPGGALAQGRERITPENAAQVEQVGIFGFGLIEGVAWSPDGETVAVAGTLGVTLYDSERFEAASFHRLEIPEERTCAVAYSPDGSLLATASGSRLWSQPGALVIRLWDTASESIIAEWQVEYPNSFSVALAFSPDGSELVLTRNRTSSVWDLSDLSDVSSLPTEAWNDAMRRWYAPDADFVPPEEGATSAYSPDGRLIAYCCEGQMPVLLNISTGERISLQEHSDPVPISMYFDGIYFSPNSRLLVLEESYEAGIGQLRVWDTTIGEELLYYHRGQAWALGFHPSESAILFSDGYNGLLSWRAGEEVPRYALGYQSNWWTNRYVDLAFSPGGQTLATVRHRAIEFWDVNTLTKRDAIYRAPESDSEDTFFTGIAYSPDDSLFAIADSTGLVQLFDVGTLEERTAVQYGYSVYDVAFSPDGHLLAVYSYIADVETAVALFDVDSVLHRDGSEPINSEGRIFHLNLQGWIYNVVFDPQGIYLALTGAGAELWDVDEVLRQGSVGNWEGLDNSAMVGNPGRYSTAGPLAFNPDGTLLATGSNGIDCYLAVWEVETETLRTCIDAGEEDRAARTIAFNADGSILVSVDGRFSQYSGDHEPGIGDIIHLWDAQTGELLADLNGHFEDIWQIAFSPDGTLLASAAGGTTCSECPNFDGTVRLWAVPMDD